VPKRLPQPVTATIEIHKLLMHNTISAGLFTPNRKRRRQALPATRMSGALTVCQT